MKKNNKYYTPEIEEFHVGFEYEWLNISNGEWLKKIYSSMSCPYNAPERTRVKHLDKKDIESLGWEMLNLKWNKVSDERTYKLDKYTMLFFGYNISKNNKHLKGRVTIYEYEDILFNGSIKNISELKILIKKLNI